MNSREVTLSVVSESPDSRLAVILREYADKPIVLRSESFGPNVGWFTQQEIELTRAEFSGLRNVLGISVPRGCEKAVTATSSDSADVPAVLSLADARRRRA